MITRMPEDFQCPSLPLFYSSIALCSSMKTLDVICRNRLRMAEFLLGSIYLPVLHTSLTSPDETQLNRICSSLFFDVFLASIE